MSLLADVIVQDRNARSIYKQAVIKRQYYKHYWKKCSRVKPLDPARRYNRLRFCEKPESTLCHDARVSGSQPADGAEEIVIRWVSWGVFS